MIASYALMQKANDSEDELILQAKIGSHAAFEALYRMHVGRVYGICVRILSDRSWAEEVTQKIFIHAWIKLNSFRGESRFSSWLYRIAINMVLDEMKAKRVRDDQIDCKIIPFATQHSEPVRNLRLDLNNAIDSLPRRARLIFVLHDLVGLTHEEIAEALNVEPGTCKAQLSRARRLLRGVLKR